MDTELIPLSGNYSYHSYRFLSFEIFERPLCDGLQFMSLVFLLTLLLPAHNTQRRRDAFLEHQQRKNSRLHLLNKSKSSLYHFQVIIHTIIFSYLQTMLVKTFGSAVYGVEAITITIEVNWLSTSGKDMMIVGLPDNAVKESLQRVESTFKTNNYNVPRTKVVVNMAPADIKKSGTAFDLPIALGILGASGQIQNSEALANYVIMGELSLDGEIRSIRGALPIAIQARKEGFKGLIVPVMNAKEAGMVNNLNVYGVSHIKEVIDFFEKEEKGLEPTVINTREEFFHSQYDF